MIGDGAGSTSAAEILVWQDGPVLWVRFNRPEQHNAMTWAMYDGLERACEQADASGSVRVMAVTGAGRAFAAGTDISQFAEFADDPARRGIEYERRVRGVLERLIAVDVPTVAVINGYCLGGGLAIAASCDIRMAAQGSRFGAPIARTLGNCLSARTVRMLVSHLGPGRTADLVLRARLLSVEEVAAAGFVTEVCAADELDAAAASLVGELATHAPLTMWALKETMRRLSGVGASRDEGGENAPETDSDVVARVYGSADFAAGVAAFGTKRQVAWTGT